MEENITKAGTLKLLGGRISLDYANTADWHASDQPVEYLTSYSALVAWGEHVGILNNDQAASRLEEAGCRPAEATAVLERAVALREAIYRVFVATSAGSSPGDDDLAILNAELSRALPHLRIVKSEGVYTWEWEEEAGALDRVLWPVAHDAANLLASRDLDRVRQCSDDRCGWLFLDTSRNRSRRWCSMEDCGNRAKARRHYERSRAGAEPQRR